MYAPGASVLNLTATHGATVTLYAQWAGDVVVMYDANGGEIENGIYEYPATYNSV